MTPRIYAVQLKSCGKLWGRNGHWTALVADTMFFTSRRGAEYARQQLRMWPVKSMAIVSWTSDGAK